MLQPLGTYAVSFQPLLEWELKGVTICALAHRVCAVSFQPLLEWELKVDLDQRDAGGVDHSFIPAFAGVGVERILSKCSSVCVRCVSFQPLLEWELKEDGVTPAIGTRKKFQSSLCWSGS